MTVYVAPPNVKHFINDTLRGYLNVFCTVYINDVPVYSNSVKEHKKHVCAVLEKLKEAGLQLDIDKSKFFVTEVKYLGLIISTEGIRMDAQKVQVIKDWKRPRSVKDVQTFLGFANFYRRFI